MSSNFLSRRHLLQLGSAASAAALLPAAPRAEALSFHGITPGTVIETVEAFAGAVVRGYTFQNFMMDAYATGQTPRLIQSYSDQVYLGGPTGFTYDNAVAIHAYLARGLEEDVERAAYVGGGLIYGQGIAAAIGAEIAQLTFSTNKLSGALCQAYAVDVENDGGYASPAYNTTFAETFNTGDQAWAGMAQAQLYQRTKVTDFLDSALAVANWIVASTYDTRGPGGYTFGLVVDPSRGGVAPSLNGKSTEHNIDVYAFFTMLSKIPGTGTAANGMTWAALAAHAAAFIAAMYNPAGPFFYTGTLNDQMTINTTPIPEDCQTWSYLASLNATAQGTIDWALANLESTDTSSAPNTSLTGSASVHGLVFSTASFTDPTTANADPKAVWLEGTGHAAAALTARVLARTENLGGMLRDLTAAVGLLQQCTVAQATLGLGQKVHGIAIQPGLGLVAATSLMDTGFYYSYSPALHIGATGWFLIAGLAANPFQLGYRVIG